MKQENYKTNFENLSEMKNQLGKELGISKWIEITQEKIKKFAQITEDEQWIHLDIEKSKLHSPYKTTVAHGFMILSLATRFSYDSFNVKNVKMGINYGLDKVRFMSATPTGGFVRGRVSLLEFEEKSEGAKYKLGITVELRGQDKPVCVAETLAIAYK